MAGTTWTDAARRGLAVLVLGVLTAAAACETEEVIFVDDDPRAPAPPRALDAWYHGGAVHVTWELHPGWDGESFRVYGKRLSDADYFLIAEVTNCTAGLCSYTDVNIVPGVTYRYYVAAVDPGSGAEAASDYSVDVFVPQPDPPPVPGGTKVIALDGAAYLTWDDRARDAGDFSHYRVWLIGSEGDEFLLGETDSQGFLDELAENGLTYRYFVTSVDADGHESAGSGVAEGTPRPDFHNEWVWDYFDRPGLAGFRFQADENTDPVVGGSDPGRHFRLETDADGWWLVPGPGVRVYPDGFATSALKCGPGADAGCTSVEVAPTSGYIDADLGLVPQTTYLLQVTGDDGLRRYGAVRVTLLGFDQEGDAIMIFDWAYQLQAGNPKLSPGLRVPTRGVVKAKP